MKRGLERALDECLSQLNTGEFGLEEVLARYPEHEAELRPLLRTAMLVRQVPQVVPSPEARAAGRRRLLAAVAKKRREKAPARAGLLRRLGQSAAILVQPLVQRPQRQSLRLAQAIAALLVIVSLVGVGTVGVAAGSLPDSPLYPIKLTAERVKLALTTAPASKARLHMDYSEKRLDEARALAEAGKGLYETALQAMESENNGALAAISQVSEKERLSLLGDFTRLTARQQALLEEMKKPGSPPSDQEAVEKALESAEEYQRIATGAMTEPDLLLTPSPRPTDTAAAYVHAGTPTSVPTATPMPPTAVPPTPTPVPPTAMPIPTSEPTAAPIPTPTAQADVPFQPTVEPTATETPQADVPFRPTAGPTMEPSPTLTATSTLTPTATLTSTPTLMPTATPLPTATATPVPTSTPTPKVEPTATPTPQVEVPFQPLPASSVTNCRVSDAPQGAAVPEFPAGTGKVYIVFDYAYMAGEEVGIKVTDSAGHVLLEEVRTLSGDGTVSITFSAGGEGFTIGRYLVNIYQGGGVIKTIIWDVVE